MSETGRFEYLLAAYLHAVEDGNRDAVQILVAMWRRWPARFARWVYRHQDDIPPDVRSAIVLAGLGSILRGNPDAAPTRRDLEEVT